MSTADPPHESVGYSRYDDTDPLTHATRAELYERIETEPGLYLSQLGRRLDVPVSTIRYHARVLVEEDRVVSSADDGRRRFYPQDTEHPELIARLRSDGAAKIVAVLARDGPLTVSALAAELDRHPSTVSHHLDRLVEVDAVTRTKRGREVVSRLSPDAPPWLGVEPAAADR